jgi:hypothetical protein
MVLAARSARADHVARSALILANLSRTFSALEQWLRPMLEAKGARVKARLKAERLG